MYLDMNKIICGFLNGTFICSLPAKGWYAAFSSSYSVKEIVVVFSSETTSPIDLKKIMQLPHDEAYKL